MVGRLYMTILSFFLPKMKELDRYCFSLTIAFLLMMLFYPQPATPKPTPSSESAKNVVVVVGAIVDNSSRMGKEAKVAMEMAIHDFNTQTNNQSFVLHLRINKQTEPLQAALAARRLIKTKKVQAILGPHTWEESSLIADVCTQNHIPILSLADSTPQWATLRWPFLLLASSSPNQRAQMKAVAAIVQSWEWRRVTLIYEGSNFASDGVISHFSASLREVGAEIDQLVALPPFSSSSFSEELQKLKGEQCRVFVVHLSLPLAIRLFNQAKKMNMTTKDYVWITTDTTTSLIHSLDASAISSMQGVVGVKAYFPDTGLHFQDFSKKFRKKFSRDYPEEKNHEPGIFAVQAYDATWAISLALGDTSKSDGQELVQKVSSTNFDGLTGKIRFNGKQLSPAQTFQIVNVIGRSYRELGFWTEGRGFSESIDQTVVYNTSMEVFGQVFWPGGPRDTPRGWTLPTEIKRLRIGVPNGSTFKQFVNVEYDNQTNQSSVKGFSIEVFNATIDRLPYSLPCEFVPFDGPYDDLVKQVHLKNFSAVVGDVNIIARRYEYAEFTEPYTDSGLMMIVPVQSETNRALLFMKPFTTDMWVLILAINIYNGFVVWLIERNHCPELQGSVVDQVGTLLWLAFNTLFFSLHGEKLHSNLSRMAMVVWLFVALVISQSYTASLTSMLTVQQLRPTTRDIETLKNGNALVGHCKGSFVATYLKDVLGFKNENIKNFSSPQEFDRALKSGEIAAAFLEGPLAKLFLAMYCKSFILAGPSYQVAGFGFVFPKGSPMLADINEALLKVVESGKLKELENSMTGSEQCLESDFDNASLNLNSFWILFIITGGTSTVALVIYVILASWKFNDVLVHKITWRLILASFTRNYHMRSEHHGTICPVNVIV